MEEYDSDSDSSASSSSEAPDLQISQDYLNSAMDKFLLSNGNMDEVSKEAGTFNLDGLTTLRTSLKDGFDRSTIVRSANEDTEEFYEKEEDEPDAQWDCETILCKKLSKFSLK